MRLYGYIIPDLYPVSYNSIIIYGKTLIYFTIFSHLAGIHQMAKMPVLSAFANLNTRINNSRGMSKVFLICY